MESSAEIFSLYLTIFENIKLINFIVNLFNNSLFLIFSCDWDLILTFLNGGSSLYPSLSALFVSLSRFLFKMSSLFFLTSVSFVCESSVLSSVSPLQSRLLIYLGGVFNDRSGVTHTGVFFYTSMLLPTLSHFSVSSGSWVTSGAVTKGSGIVFVFSS